MIIYYVSFYSKMKNHIWEQYTLYTHGDGVLYIFFFSSSNTQTLLFCHISNLYTFTVHFFIQCIYFTKSTRQLFFFTSVVLRFWDAAYTRTKSPLLSCQYAHDVKFYGLYSRLFLLLNNGLLQTSTQYYQKLGQNGSNIVHKVNNC